jgi:GT2 family glycosyltransferase
MKKVSIIVTNWNGKELIEGCLRSIIENTDYPDYEIIVVDNGSTDGSVEMLERDFPQVRLIKNKQNMGFGYANNQAFKIAKGEYVFLLNNDSRIVEKNWLRELLEIAESDHRIAVVGCSLNVLKENKKITFKEVHNTVGTMLIRKDVIEKIGDFDTENFSPIYGEETDWNYRARSVGYKIIKTSVPMIHMDSVTTKKGFGAEFQYVLINTNRLKAMLYNLSFIDFMKRIPGLGLIFVQSFEQRTTLWLLKSYWNNIKNFKNIMKERWKRKKIAKKLRMEQKEIGEEWF